MKRLKNKNVIMVSKLCKLIKNQLIAYLQVVHFMAYKLHFNKAIYKKKRRQIIYSHGSGQGHLIYHFNTSLVFANYINQGLCPGEVHFSSLQLKTIPYHF